MISIYAFLIASMCFYEVFGFEITVDQTPLTATCSPDTIVQVFSSISYIDLISSYDPEVIFGLRYPPDIAANRIYNEDLRLFQNIGFSNAEYLASTGARTVSLLADEFTIPSYFLNVGTNIAEFLVERGLLRCDNVIETATKIFENQQVAFQSLDPAKFESYEEALVTGMHEFLEGLGHTLDENEVNWQLMVDSFRNQYIW